MRELLEPGRVPNCDYVHEQANEINYSVGRLALIEAEENKHKAGLDKVERFQSELTNEMADDLLRTEFINDSVASPSEHAAAAINSRYWRINRSIIRHLEGSASYLDTTKEHMKQHIDRHEIRIEAHTARHHRFHNIDCAYDDIFMSPLQAMQTQIRALGVLLVYKLRRKQTPPGV